MSSPAKFIAALVVLFVAIGISHVGADADVTGSFSIDVMIVPQTTASEISPLLIDFVNRLDLTYVVSGLSTSLSSRIGIAGVEDIILSSSATLGALELGVELIFARFVFGSVDPYYENLHFISKSVTSSISLGGVTFTNLAMVQDANMFGAIAGFNIPNLGILGFQSELYAFGDVLTVSGQTPSGVGLSFETGICIGVEGIKIKGRNLPRFPINFICATAPKPDILFDYERIVVTGVPLAPGVTAGGFVECVRVTACTVEASFTFNTPSVPIPFTSTLIFDNLTELSFSGADLIFNAGAGTLVVSISETGTISATSVSINATLNPDTNSATLIIDGTIAPGAGLADAVVILSVTRLGFTMSAVADFGIGIPATFSGITFRIDVPGGLVDFSAATVFNLMGLVAGEFSLSVNF